MKHPIIVILLVFCGFLNSCNFFIQLADNPNSVATKEPPVRNYNEIVETVIAKQRDYWGILLDHIPSSLENYEVGFSNVNYCCDYYISFFTLQIHLKTDDTLSDYFLRKSIAEYEASDTCNFVLYRTTHHIKSLPNSLAKENETYSNIHLFGSCIESRFPIPNFLARDTTDIDTDLFNEEIFSLTTYCHLDKSFKLLILETAPGIHHNIQNNGFSIESLGKWSKGYSKGVAISEKKNELFYWVIAW